MWMYLNYNFIVKVPLYDLHLWPPRVHVEARYCRHNTNHYSTTQIRQVWYHTIVLIGPLSDHLNFLFLSLDLGGTLMTISICLWYKDCLFICMLYGFSHCCKNNPNLLIILRAITVIISHGLIYFVLFCLANTTYKCAQPNPHPYMRPTTTTTPQELATSWLLSVKSNFL